MTSSEPHNPSDREIVFAAVDIWNSDKRTENIEIPDLFRVILKKNPRWRNDLAQKTEDGESVPPFTAERLATCLSTANLLPSHLSATGYAHKIKSKFPIQYLEMPKGADHFIEIKVISSSASDDNQTDEVYKGKGIFAKTIIPNKKTIWEELPLFRVPPVSNVKAMRDGSACAYCGQMFSTLRGIVSCTKCPAQFCSAKCRAAEIKYHAVTWHSTKNKYGIKNAGWLKYEKFCVDNNWMSGYAVGLILIKMISENDPSTDIVTVPLTKEKLTKGQMLRNQFEAMATVSQKVRLENSEAHTSVFAQGQLEQTWEQAYELLTKKCLQKAIYLEEEGENETASKAKNTGNLISLSYSKYLNYVGTWNLNNIREQCYLVQSNLNHSCDPNVHVIFPEKKAICSPIKINAIKDIAEGEELTASYVNPEYSFKDRQFELKKNWGFNCACPRCVREKKELHVEVDEEGNIF